MKCCEIITVDCIVALPKSKGYDSILVICDRYTKMVKFIPCNETITAEETTKLFQTCIFMVYGAPRQLITDRGLQFVAKMFRHLFKTFGIYPSLSTAFHPQTDGQMERTNQELEQYLRGFINL